MNGYYNTITRLIKIDKFFITIKHMPSKLL